MPSTSNSLIIGNEILLDNAMYRVVQISERPKDGSKKIVLQEVMPESSASPQEPML